MLETLILFGILLAASAFFGAVEIATLSLSEGKVRTMVREKLPGARLVERLKAKPQRFLIAMLVANNVINISAAAVATELALEVFGSRGVAIATGAVAFLILTFGEILPKTFGQAYAEYVSRYTAPVVLFIIYALRPVEWFFERLIKLFSFGAFEQSRRQSAKIAEDEIKSLFQLGVEKGSIKQYEQDIAERLFRFNDMLVDGVMRPLGKVIMLEGRLSIETALADAALSGYSRFPVYEGSVERIVGVVHIKDIVRAYSEGRKEATLSDIVEPPTIVRTGEKLSAAFMTMRKENMPFALVYDEQNQLVGLATLEDVLEELLGEMYDESDARKWGAVT